MAPRTSDVQRPTLIREQVSDYHLTKEIILGWLREKYTRYTDDHFDVEHVNAVFKFNVPQGLAEVRINIVTTKQPALSGDLGG
ncbi:hypothetical protein LTR10_009235 [Elasticomyces elasticus]|nr:hypothetical protein LTR10_009235 [Elasticomyces elasticus]KAK4971665.1 hypothetical protein LTR42_007393 [Elasticomyces elasticus]